MICASQNEQGFLTEAQNSYIQYKLVKWLVTTNSNLHGIQTKEFAEFVCLLNSNFNVPTEEKVREHVNVLFKKTKEGNHKGLKLAKKATISIDASEDGKLTKQYAH